MTVPWPVVAVPVIGTWLFFRRRRRQRLVDEWARANNLRVVRRLWTGWRVGPFPVAALGRQAVEHLEVSDQDGRLRRCWLKMGDFVVGLLDDRIEVSWESDAA